MSSPYVYDPLGRMLSGTTEAQLDPVYGRQQEQINKQLRQEEAERKRAAAEMKKREAERIRLVQAAIQRLKIPGALRPGDNNWQLQQRAAGFGFAPDKPPLDWDRMDARTRQWHRNRWR